VYRSLNHIYAQVIDDEQARTIAAASTTEKTLGAKTGGNIEAAQLVGKTIAERTLAAGVERVVFDRGGYLYHGRVKALTDAARAAGLNKDEVREPEPEAAGAEAASPEEASTGEAGAKPKRAKKDKKEPSAKEPKAKAPKAPKAKESSVEDPGVKAPAPAEPAAGDAGAKPEPAELKNDNDGGGEGAKAKEEQ
jgi:large subunit ribosomal protein L18